MPVVEERVDRLERALEEFITNVGIEFNKLYNSQMRTEAELRDFKDEMKDFKDEMRQDRKDMNIKWGEMAKKLGTMVEDLVSPSIPRIVRESFGLEVEFFGIRIKKKLIDGRLKEYDAMAAAGDYLFLNSTKSTLETSDIRQFVKDIEGFREFFPEYKKKKIIGILASLFVDKSIIKYAEKTGFMMLAVGEELMEIKNSEGFHPKKW